MSQNNHKSRLGFTVVEMIIVAPIVVLVIGTFIFAIVKMTGDVLVLRNHNTLAFNVQDALNRIEQDVKISGGFLATNNINITSPQGYDHETASFSNNTLGGHVLILNSYATTSNPLSETRNILYAHDQPNACGSDNINQNQPVMMNTVYFIDNNNTLWRRVIAPAFYNSVGCSSPWQQPSCDPALVNPSIPFCKVKDERLVDGIQPNDFVINYFSSNGAAISLSGNDATRQTSLKGASTVSVSITASNLVAGRTVTQTSVTQASSPNNNVVATSQTIAEWPQNNWINYDNIDTGYAQPGYRKTDSGVVVLKGMVKRSDSCVDIQLIGTLPEEFRPATELLFTTSLNNSPVRIDVSPNGEVSSHQPSTGPSSCWVSLEGIHFIPTSEMSPNGGHNYSSTNLISFSNSWINYAGFTPASYVTDDNGRINLQGLVKDGVVANGTKILSLSGNTGIVPSKNMYFPANISGSVAPFFGVNSSDNTKNPSNYSSIVAKGGSGTGWLSLQSMYYPQSVGNWNNLTLSGSWTIYDSSTYFGPQYTKGSDGLVSLRGFVNNTSDPDGTIIATLPAGYRPLEEIVFNVVNNGGYGRVDILNTGEIKVVSGSANWLSLDNIVFYAVQ